MTPDPIVYAQYGPVAEGGSFVYRGVLTQEDGLTPVPGNSIQSITLTLTDSVTQAVINSRNAQNVLNLNQCTFDSTGSTGAFAWDGLPADDPFLRVDPPPSEGDLEVHQAILSWTYLNLQATILTGRRKIYITVEKYLGATVTPVGTGSQTYTDVILEPVPDGAEPIEGAQVWVTSDQAGLTLVAGPQLTDCNGSFTFELNPGGYWLWVKSDSYTFATNPTAITVS